MLPFPIRVTLSSTYVPEPHRDITLQILQIKPKWQQSKCPQYCKPNIRKIKPILLRIGGRERPDQRDWSGTSHRGVELWGFSGPHTGTPYLKTPKIFHRGVELWGVSGPHTGSPYLKTPKNSWPGNPTGKVQQYNNTTVQQYNTPSSDWFRMVPSFVVSGTLWQRNKLMKISWRWWELLIIKDDHE